jgi:nucleoporin NUP159
MRLYEQDLTNLKEERSQRQKLLRELQSNLLKGKALLAELFAYQSHLQTAGTRREEIGRFLKAQHDNDFARMLKARTLGPEHLETQTHLRRGIRVRTVVLLCLLSLIDELFARPYKIAFKSSSRIFKNLRNG